MNERIKDLKEQALIWSVETLDPDALNDNEWGVAIDKKLAELIVQDIINVLESKNEIRHIASTTFTLSVVEGTIEKSINAITEHFGMKQHHRIKNERTVGRKVSSL